MKSSPASGAGARRRWPTCTRCRWSSLRSTTGPRSNTPSSRTCQRADLNPIEEATGYRRLMDEFGYAYADLAQILGKSRPHHQHDPSSRPPARGQGPVVEGRITAGHARALLAVTDPVSVARRIVETGLSVRDVEAIAQTDPGSGSEHEAPADGRKGCGHPRGRTGARRRARACGHDPPPGPVRGGRIRYKALDQLDGLPPVARLRIGLSAQIDGALRHRPSHVVVWITSAGTCWRVRRGACSPLRTPCALALLLSTSCVRGEQM